MSRSGSPTNRSLAKKLSERLIVKRDSGCWEVKGTPDDAFDYRGQELYPFEFAWVSYTKPNVNAEWFFTHVAPMPTCGNIMCVNPAHCAGGKTSSLEARLSKSLLRNRKRNYPLQDFEIDEIQELRGEDITPEEIAERYGVSAQTIRKYWRDYKSVVPSFVGPGETHE